jgi:ribonuclease J
MSSERLIYLPLGGAGEIGMNAYVYGYGKPGKERLIVVDLGVAFPDMDTSPGVDLIIPDIAWLEARRNQWHTPMTVCARRFIRASLRRTSPSAS